jgi:hypothetical protein
MNLSIQKNESLGRWAQVSSAQGVQLVRVVSASDTNSYTVQAVEFDEEGALQDSLTQECAAVNVAELASSPGQVATGTVAVAIDVEGQWVMFVPAASSAVFPARVMAAAGQAVYTVIEQSMTGATGFANKTGAVAVAACNVAELNVGSGQAVDVGTLVMVLSVMDTGNPPTLRYVFDRPVYAKYL